MASCPAVALNLVRQAGGRVMQFGSEFSRTQPESAEVRLAEVLKRLASTAGEAVNGGMRIPRCVSRGTLAHQVGCTRETVARMLSTLEVAGGVVRHGRELVVDANRLDTIISVRLLARNG
jgi:CRP-like cAMP-binding protein